MWQVMATVSRTSKGWSSSVQVPLFFLSPDYSLSTAAKIAGKVLAPFPGIEANFTLWDDAKGVYGAYKKNKKGTLRKIS